MNKLPDDISNKIYKFSGKEPIKTLCATNISKEMNKIQSTQIRKLTKQFIKESNNIDIFLSSNPKCVEKYILENLQKKDLIKVVNQLLPHADETYSPLEINLLEFMYDLEVIGTNSINNAIDSLQKKELCSVWKDIFLEMRHYD